IAAGYRLPAGWAAFDGRAARAWPEQALRIGCEAGCRDHQIGRCVEAAARIGGDIGTTRDHAGGTGAGTQALAVPALPGLVRSDRVVEDVALQFGTAGGLVGMVVRLDAEGVELEAHRSFD